MTVSSVSTSGYSGYSSVGAFAANVQRQALIAQQEAQARLDSGKRINSPTDDPASNALINSLRTQLAAAQIAAQNAGTSGTSATAFKSIQTATSSLLNQVNTVRAAVASGDTSGVNGLVASLQALAQASVNGQKVYAGDAANKGSYNIRYVAPNVNLVTGDKLGSSVQITSALNAKGLDVAYGAVNSTGNIRLTTNGTNPTASQMITLTGETKVTLTDTWTHAINGNTSRMEILNERGDVVKSFTPISAPYTQTITTTLGAGTYQVRVVGDSREQSVHQLNIQTQSLARNLGFNVDGKSYKVALAAGTRTVDQMVADLKSAISTQTTLTNVDVALENNQIVIRNTKTGSSTIGGFTGQAAQDLGLTGKTSSNGAGYTTETIANVNSTLTFSAGGSNVRIANMDRYATMLTKALAKNDTASLKEMLGQLSTSVTVTNKAAAVSVATFAVSAANQTTNVSQLQAQIDRLEKVETPIEQAKIVAAQVQVQQATFVMNLQKQHEDRIKQILAGAAPTGSVNSLGMPIG